MSKKEFMKHLKEALENELTASVVTENLDYYGSYIDGEMRGGRSEQEVVGGLGDPWAIARTIIETERRSGNTYAAYTAEDAGVKGKRERNEGDGGRMPAGLRRILVIAGVLLAVCLIVSAVVGVITALAPVVVPVIVIAAIVRMFQRRR